MYTGSNLGDCTTTGFSDGVFEFRVQHVGDDAWCMHSVTLELAYGEAVQCIPGIWLDDNDDYFCNNY